MKGDGLGELGHKVKENVMFCCYKKKTTTFSSSQRLAKGSELKTILFFE